MCDIFLRNVDNNYILMILGKNAEPVSGALVDLEFTHRFFHEPLSQCLKTDKEGMLHLGRLKNIKFVRFF